MIKIIAVRHGETVENAAGINGGWLPGHLNRKGIAQARDAAQKLAASRFDVIYSSDLKRAADTARIIAERHPGVRLIFVKSLREKNLGELQGKPRPPKGVMVLGLKTKRGETLGQFRSRVKRFMDGLAASRRGQTVLLVTHGGTMRAMATVLDGTPSSVIPNFDRVKNAEIRRFTYKG